MMRFLALFALIYCSYVQADNPVYRFEGTFNNLFINVDSNGNEGVGEDLNLNTNCMDPDRVGELCDGKLIVDNDMLRELVSTQGDYSDESIFTGQVTSMSTLFFRNTPIHSISGWNTSSVTSMHRMFHESPFNQDIGSWDTSNVRNMSEMFKKTGNFNQDISQWDTSSVVTMEAMFHDAESFNQDIGRWDVSKVSNMTYMFYSANEFNADISGWCVRNFSSTPNAFSRGKLEATNMPMWGICPSEDIAQSEDCFDPANINKIGISGVCEGKVIISSSRLKKWVWGGTYYGDDRVFTGQVTSLSRLFFEQSIDYSISGWDTSNVTDMSAAFFRSSMGDDITGWDTSNVRNMSEMFKETDNFNQDISQWDTSNVVTMEAMFHDAESFNQDIGRWDVSKVSNMTYMFYSAYYFNADISGWCVRNFSSTPNAFSRGKLEATNMPMWGICPSEDIAQSEDCFDPANINKIGISGVCEGKVIISSSRLKKWVWGGTYYGDDRVFTGQVTSLSRLFFEQSIDYSISGWDTSNVTDMSAAFFRSSMGDDITGWDTSNVRNMSEMFKENDNFNQDISQWDTSNVVTMEAMFHDAESFNQDIGKWDVSKVSNMTYMFYGAYEFNADISGWCVRNFSSTPNAFSRGKLEATNMPIWGTCPE